MTSKEITADVNRIVAGVNNDLADFYNSLRKDVAKSKAKAQSVKDNSRKVKACPVIQEVQEISEDDRQIAMSTIKGIEKVVKNNKDDFQGVDISERGNDSGSRDSGGDDAYVTPLINVGIPKWIQELKNSVKSKLKRIKKREYFDVEGLVRGVTRKKKERGMKRIDFVYFLLDVSGSMEAFSYKGVPLKALLASYIPAVAKSIGDGMWIQVDGGKVIPQELSSIGKNDIKSLILGGGGGANFPEAIEWVKQHIINNSITNPIVIMASDAHEDFDFELLPNTIFLTTDEGWAYSENSGNGLIEQGFPNPLKGQKAIIIDIDPR